MKLKNAIKKMNKLGHEVNQYGVVFRVETNSHAIEFSANGRVSDDVEIVCISTCKLSVEKTRDSMTDYFPETYHENLKQALEFIGAA